MAARKVPRKYTSGLGESTADRRRAEIRKRATGKKKSFKPLPGDARAKTRPSQYTNRIKNSGLRQVIREETTKGTGSTRERFIKAVARVTDIPRRIIKEVYEKGLAAWAVGHRPGATQDQWARARVYSFLAKGRTVETADKQLFEEAKKALKEKASNDDTSEGTSEKNGDDDGEVGNLLDMESDSDEDMYSNIKLRY